VVSFCKTVFAEHPVSEEDRDIIIQFYKAQCFGMVIDWLRSGMKDDVHDKIHRICELQKGMLEEMIRRCIETNNIYPTPTLICLNLGILPSVSDF